jgi:hypothetical protein
MVSIQQMHLTMLQGLAADRGDLGALNDQPASA